MKQKTKGFTFIELLIAVFITAVLTTLAVMVYSSQVRSARRTDGTSTLMAIALAEERYRTNNSQYGNLTQVWNGVTTTPGGYYTLGISGNSATAYTITATAVGNQANDSESGTACNSLQLAVSNGAVTKTPTACWPQ